MSPSFVTLHLLVSEMYCLRLFIVVLQELHCLLQRLLLVVCSLRSICIPSFVLIGCCVSELHAHLCPYRNVLPEAVYCCFTRKQCCLHVDIIRYLSLHQVSLL